MKVSTSIADTEQRLKEAENQLECAECLNEHLDEIMKGGVSISFHHPVHKIWARLKVDDAVALSHLVTSQEGLLNNQIQEDQERLDLIRQVWERV